MEVGGGVAVEEGGVGFFGQEFELGCLGPVIGVVASAVFIGGGEESAAVHDCVGRGMEGYLGQLGDKRIDLFRMGACAGSGQLGLRLEQVVHEGVHRRMEDVLPVPLRELFIVIRQGEFCSFVVAILHAELPCQLALHPLVHQIVSRGGHGFEIRRGDVQGAQERKPRLRFGAEGAARCIDTVVQPHLCGLNKWCPLRLFKQGIAHRPIKNLFHIVLKADKTKRIIEPNIVLKKKGVLGHAESLAWYYLTGKRYLAASCAGCGPLDA